MSAHPQTAPSANALSQQTLTRIVHDRRGEPADVLRLVESRVSDLPVGPDDVLLRVLKTPIHPGDLHMIRGLSNGGPVGSIEAGNPRVPGFEGVGVIQACGERITASGSHRPGERVVFFSGNAHSWESHVSV